MIVGKCGVITVTGADAGSAKFFVSGDFIYPAKGYHSSLRANEDGSFDFFPKGGNRYHYVKRQARVWWMEYVEDPNGNRMSVDLEFRGHAPIIRSVTDSVGRRLNFEYEFTQLENGKAAEFLSKVNGPQGLLLNFEYNGIGNLISAKAEGDSTDELLSYEAGIEENTKSLLTKVTDNATAAVRQWQFEPRIFVIPGGLPVLQDINSIQVQSLSESDSGTTTFSYTSVSGYNDDAIVDQNGTLTSYIMNDYGAATSITAPNGTKSFVWDLSTDVLLESETDENNRTKTFTYDGYGIFCASIRCSLRHCN